MCVFTKVLMFTKKILDFRKKSFFKKVHYPYEKFCAKKVEKQT